MLHDKEYHSLMAKYFASFALGINFIAEILCCIQILMIRSYDSTLPKEIFDFAVVMPAGAIIISIWRLYYEKIGDEHISGYSIFLIVYSILTLLITVLAFNVLTKFV